MPEQAELMSDICAQFVREPWDERTESTHYWLTCPHIGEARVPLAVAAKENSSGLDWVVLRELLGRLAKGHWCDALERLAQRYRITSTDLQRTGEQ